MWGCVLTLRVKDVSQGVEETVSLRLWVIAVLDWVSLWNCAVY